LFEYIKALTNFTEKEEQLDDALVSNPTKELKDLIKKFNTYYETFVKGKKGNDGKDIPKGDSELGEPDLGGFIYCKWQLERYFFCDIFDLVQYGKYWTNLTDKVKKHEATQIKEERVPKFKQKPIFEK
jgi:hypothetical protein